MSELWFYGQQGTQRGPLEIEALRTLAASGELQPTDLVWREGMADWVPASTVPGLFVAAASMPPPPRPVQTQPPPTSTPILPPPYELVADQSGRAIATFLCGLLSLISCMCPPVGIVLGASAIALALGVKNPRNRSLAITGLICGVMGVLLGLSNMGGLYLRL